MSAAPEPMSDGEKWRTLSAKATLGPFRQGMTLMTRQTRKWSADDIAINDRIESLRIFAHFRDKDEGRSRVRVAQCETPEDAALITWLLNNAETLLARLDERERDAQRYRFLRDECDTSWMPAESADNKLPAAMVDAAIDAAMIAARSR